MEKDKTKPGATAASARRSRRGYTARGKVWMEKAGEVYMGWGRVELLQRIGQYGSIAAAARSMGMSYRNAWLEVDEMNRLAPAPLVEKGTGGVGGGHTHLMAEGEKIIAEYNELTRKFQQFLKKYA